MNRLTRRHLFGVASAATLTLTLAACQPGALSQAISDAQAVVSGVSGAYSALKQAFPKAVSKATDAQVQAILSEAPAVLAQISATADAATNAGGIRGVEAIVNQVLNIAAGIVGSIPGVPLSIMAGFQAAAVLLPILEAAANQLVPKTGAVAVAGVFRSNMTADQARAVLRR